MKLFVRILGVLAAVYFLLHLAELPWFLRQVESSSQEIATAAWTGKIMGLLIGAGIAFGCFTATWPDKAKNEGQT